MADIRGSTGGLPHLTERRYFDQGDGTYAEGHAALLYVWNTSNLDWEKAKADAGGAISTVGGGGSSTSVTVTSGSITVTSGSLTVTSGSITVTNTSFKLADAGGTNLASVSTTGAQLVSGEVASGTTDAGSPVKIGGVFNTTQPTLSTGQRGDAQQDSRGRLRVNIGQNASDATVSSMGDGFNGTAAALAVQAGTLGLNGSGSWDRIRGTSVAGLQTCVSSSINVVQLPSLGTSRTRVHLYADRAAAVTSEGVATMSITKAGASQAASAAYTVTTGKTLRIQEFGGAVITNTTAALNGRLRLRFATSGNLTSISACEAILEIASPAAVANATGTEDRTFPDGLEFAAGTSIGVTHVESASTGSVSFSIVGFEY